ncbi:MAG: DUF4124 domain-containing protein [Pseudogulbenkiania sp.]|nr:DUF4124 domain-containing protein [Pseudogulbenkiania sp.]
MKKTLFCLLLACSLTQAQTIYKYVDPSGHVTFSNTPMKGGEPVKLAPLSTYSIGDTPRSAAPASPTPATPAASGRYPSVDNATQQQRDNGRRKILEQELANEQKALGDAQKALAEGKAQRIGSEAGTVTTITKKNADGTTSTSTVRKPGNYQKYLDRVQQLQDQVTEHQKNVEALQRELGRAASIAPK